MNTRTKTARSISQMVSILLIGLVLTSLIFGSVTSNSTDESPIATQGFLTSQAVKTADVFENGDVALVQVLPMCSPSGTSGACGGG